MKNPILIILVCFLTAACATDPEEIEIEIKNKAPEAPKLSSPEDNLFCTENKLDFKWFPVTDPDGDKVSYIFEISTDINFTNLTDKRELSTLIFNKEVDKGQNYYWRVKAKDDKGNSSDYSAIRHFYTEDFQTSNSLPSVPELIKPEDNAVTGLNAELSWEATDADDDELSFDLYFGTSAAPALLEENLSEKTFTASNLDAGKTYYWKIVAKDESGGKSIGQVWSFKTE